MLVLENESRSLELLNEVYCKNSPSVWILGDKNREQQTDDAKDDCEQDQGKYRGPHLDAVELEESTNCSGPAPPEAKIEGRLF